MQTYQAEGLTEGTAFSADMGCHLQDVPGAGAEHCSLLNICLHRPNILHGML